jgi:hypothetical protein
MAKIVWIASYPRSGNTWVRFMLANLLYGPVPSSAALNELIPDIHRGIAGIHLHGNRKTLVKTHWQFDPWLPLREDTLGVIYLVRNPVDVLASNLNYYLVRNGKLAALPTEAARREEMGRWIENYIAVGGRQAWRDLGFGGWSENVLSWAEGPVPYPRLVLRYEDLKAAPERETQRMASFLGAAADPVQIAETVRRSSFEALRALEAREIESRQLGIFYSPGVDPSGADSHRFVRRGEVGGQEAILTPAQRRAALERFGAVMARFGYVDAAAQAAPAAD